MSQILRGQIDVSEPYAISSFFGPMNAEYTATNTVEYLKRVLKPGKLGEIRGLFNYNITPPFAEIENGVIKSLTPPVLDVWLHKSSAQPRRDLIIIDGPQPNRYTETVRAFRDLSKEFGVRRFITLSAAYSNIPHTREEDPSIFSGQTPTDIPPQSKPATYKGPASFDIRLVNGMSLYGIPSTGLLLSVPFYWQNLPSYFPRGVRTMLKALKNMLDINLKTELLENDIKQVDEEVTDFMKINSQFRETIENLEKQYDERQKARSQNGLKLLPEIERFLDEVTKEPNQ